MTQEEETTSKVTFDETTDFKFSAAYEAYSRAFDEASDTEVRHRLNELVTRLHGEEIGYPQFYRELDQFREDSGGKRFRKVRIQGQRKRAYRRDQIKVDRNKRHRR
ncbi:MAG: hypothetical protein JSV18_01855 [Candidatus Bathyarchaeota archaeon]|nr:MAG: hypothetical protein JSV18_01855 [Candidatus Bathyarchaeota archaeon]